MGIFAKLFGNQSTTKGVSDNAPAEQKARETAPVSSKQSVKQRQQALKQTDDLVKVIEVYQTDNDELVVESADMRLRELLTQTANEAHIPLLRETQLSLNTRQDLAAKAQSFLVRQLMIEKLDDSVSLLAAINHSDDVKTQMLAIEKLEDIDALKVLVKRYQGKKKVLYRSAKDRLAAMKTRQHHVDELQAQFDGLGQTAIAQQLSLSAVIAAEKRLNALKTEVPPTVFARHSQSLQTLTQVAKDIEAAKSARQALLRQLDEVITALQSVAYRGNRGDFNQQMNAIQQAWIDLPDWQSSEAKGLAIRFEQLLSTANSLANPYFDEKQHQNAQAKIIAQSRNWLNKNTFITQAMLSDQEKRWQWLSPLADAAQQKAMQSEFETLLAQLRDKSERQQKAQVENDAFVPGALDELAAAIEAGKVHAAENLQKQIRQRFNSDAGLSKPVYQETAGRFNRLENRLKELKRWQYFGNDHVREELIEAMQKLADSDDIDALAKADQIKALQQQWKALKSRAPEKQWAQFKTLGDKAWEPCAAYFKNQRQTSKTLLKERLDFLAEAEQHLNAVDWDHPNWKAVGESHKKFEQMWRAFPKLQERDYRQAQKAHNALVKRWDKLMDAERQREKVRREKLIQRAEEQLDNDDTQDAIDAIKALQNQWAPTLGLKKRSAEQALWERFKSACDGVFDKHHQRRDESHQAMNLAFETHRAHLDDIASLLESDMAFEQMRAEFQTRTQDLTAFEGVSDKAGRALQKQLQDITQRFEKLEHAAFADKRGKYLTQLNQQDALCMELEGAVLDEARRAALKAEWEAVEPALNDSQNAMQKRFAAALERQQAGKLAEPQKTVVEKVRDLCLQLEMAADIDSPVSFQAAREQLRLTLLDNAMNGDKSFDALMTDAGLYQSIVAWHTIEKGAFNRENSGDDLENWCQRFENAVKGIRAKIQHG